MNRTVPSDFDPRLDILLERTVAAPVKRVWAAWTVPARLHEWFVPSPYTLTDCEVDLRPGGVFRTVMRWERAASWVAWGATSR